MTLLRDPCMLRERLGAEQWERLMHLDQVRSAPRVSPATPRGIVGSPSPDYDVVFAGGGLSILLAARLALLGLRVAVFERAVAGRAHREWNASFPELQQLTTLGLVDAATLERLCVARYDRAFCRFGSGATHVVRGVLDCAVDAGGLLAHVRTLATALGVEFHDGAAVLEIEASAAGARILVGGAGSARAVHAHAAVEARGASSPYATADLICPTVGGVLRGLERGDGPLQVDPRVGEILVTTRGLVGGLQPIWEAFPGRDDLTTVYLFEYQRADSPQGSLVSLYARFFDELAEYKQGEATLERATFGYIPGWSRLTPRPHSPHPRIVLVGDAAALHSPLTFCGFGSMLRSVGPMADALAERVRESHWDAKVQDDAPIHRRTGLLARLMASSGLAGHELNELLDVAFGELSALGDTAYAALLRDEMSARDFFRFVVRTAGRKPSVYRSVQRALGVPAAVSWASGLSRDALLDRA